MPRSHLHQILQTSLLLHSADIALALHILTSQMIQFKYICEITSLTNDLWQPLLNFQQVHTRQQGRWQRGTLTPVGSFSVNVGGGIN